MFTLIKIPLEVTQSTSRPPRIVEHIKKVDPSFLNHQNWFRESQDMFFCMPVNSVNRLIMVAFTRIQKNDMLALPEPIWSI